MWRADSAAQTGISVDDLSTAAGGSLPARLTTIAFGEINAANALVAYNGRFAVQVTNAEGHTEYRQYNGRFGAPVRLEGPNGLETFWTYDEWGRQTAEIRADGTRSDVYRAWCESGVSACPTGGAIKIMSLETGSPASVVVSDKFGREISSAAIGFDGTPVISNTFYDEHGRVERVEKPYLYGAQPTGPQLFTEFDYDELSRAILETAPGSIVTATEYFGPGTNANVSPIINYQAAIKVTNSKSQTTTQYFDTLGRMIAAIDAADTVTRYAHDAHGNVTSIVVDNDASTEIASTYDILGRKLTMTDPDLSPDPSTSWIYQYNSFGELRRQVDAKGTVFLFAYDELGRLVQRTDDDAGANEGDTTLVYDLAAYGIGQLESVTGPQGDSKVFTYDQFGRPETTTTTLPGVSGSFVSGQSFDYAGRTDVITYPASTAYPNGLQVRYEYNDRGYLAEVRNNDAGNQLYWRLDEQTTTLTEFSLGNGISTGIGYDEVTGKLLRIRSSTFGEDGDVQDLEYDFDTLGNLTRRADLKRDLEELIDASAGYDALNRIVEVRRPTSPGSGWVGATTTLAIDYDPALGNIESKTGLGTYGYGTPDTGCAIPYAGPHAVTGIGAADFCYDKNGNETFGHDFSEGADRTTTWTAFNKPATISDGTDTVSFEYGADRARFRQVNGDVTTLYVDGIFEREIVGGVKTDIHYIMAGGEAVAIYKSHEDTSEETLYLHKDHLGSVVEITDESGTVVESLSFDAFGQRRDAADWDGAALTPADTPRGYTGHEHLDDLNLVHMNGRVYDPSIGRMLSADPYVQFPSYSQSFNRYSYVLNNPLRYTDPSGYCIAAGPSCPMSGLGGFSGGGLGAGGSGWQGGSSMTTVVSIGYMLVPQIGRIFSAMPGSGYPGISNNPWGQVIQTCPMTDWLCGGMQFEDGGGFDRYIDMFGGLYHVALEQTIGIIGWSVQEYVQVEYYFYQWLAYLENGFANNSSQGTPKHAQYAENITVLQRGPGPNASFSGMGGRGGGPGPEGSYTPYGPRPGGQPPPFDGFSRLGSDIGGLFRFLIYDFQDPFGGSYLLEAVTLIPIAKVAKVAKYGDEAAGLLRGSDEVASETANKLDEVYHYTPAGNADSITAEGLAAGPNGVFTTTSGNLSPLQAQIDLAMRPNRGLPDALFRIDLNEVRRLGIEISNPQSVRRSFNMPGGGTEVIIQGPVPPSALERIR